MTYSLPPGAGKTWLVTLAIVEKNNPDWIVSTFIAGAAREVTAENKGRFTETWDGLDDNFMPVPPGDYAVKGICTPAQKWRVDGEWHAITPRFAGGASPWLPSPEQWDVPVPFGGDPVNAPIQDVAVGPNGVAVFYYQYLENGTNCPMFDLNKPIDYAQFIRAFNSGGAGGGPCAATDGEMVWAFSTDGGPKFVYRADMKSFGQSPGANRRNGYLPTGWVTSMAVLTDKAAGQSYVYVAQRGKIEEEKPEGNRKYSRYSESTTDFVDIINIHNGADGAILGTIPLARPQALVVRNSSLYAMHADGAGPGAGLVVSKLALKNGLADGAWKKLFAIPSTITPADFEMDSKGRSYIIDTAANKVYQLSTTGKVVQTYGRLAVQKPGAYDPETLMSPAKLAAWTDAGGNDRVLIVEMSGPNRVSEWSGETGKLLREFPTYQTKCNNGYAIDPADPSIIYLPGQADWLTRYKIDYTTREWKVDAVWPDVPAGQRRGLDKPVAIRRDKQLYLASEKTLLIFRLAGDKWMQSAGVIQREKEFFLWNDADGNGIQDEAELRPTTMPGQVITYHGQRWLPDLSYVAGAQGGRDVWRLAPEGFDEHGNPIFKEWKKVLTDSVLAARVEGTATALHGANELSETFANDWMQVDGSLAEGFYMQARGKTIDANRGSQHKISRYIPDGKGGYTMKWRVGRSVLGNKGVPGEIYGGMRLYKPIGGLLTVVDQSRSGLLLYTEDGLYVDTLFPDSDKKNVGAYQQPGEFFAGTVYPNAVNGKIYYASGKYTPLLYEMENWSLKGNPVQRLTTVQETVRISAAQIAAPPEVALALRGGAGSAKVARFAPALGGAVLDGSLTGWESVEPVRFASSKTRTVEMRGLYDPETLFLRWEVKLDAAFQAPPLPPLERLFTHDQGAHTVSLYFQGDVDAAPKGPAVGRPGDVRFVFGLFKEGDKVVPAAVGLYPKWTGKGATPQVYRTPVGEAYFAHVGAIPGVMLGYQLDAKGKGFVITAAIPRAAIPALKQPFGNTLKTLVNFDANLGGHDKIWWSNADGSASKETYDEPSEARLYPGSWAPLLFQGIDEGVPIKQWLVLGPFGGPGTENFTRDPQNKEEVRKFFEAKTYEPDDGKVDPKAIFKGEMIKGYWKSYGHLTWKPEKLADLDTRAIIGDGSQMYYGATWIYAPEDTEITFAYQGQTMTYIRWFLNETEVSVPYKEYVEAGPRQLRLASREVQLKKGWNQVRFRVFNTGYVPFRMGLVLQGDQTKLWGLRFAGMPPVGWVQ